MRAGAFFFSDRAAFTHRDDSPSRFLARALSGSP